MKKHFYRSTDIKELKVEELSESVKERRIVLGVDVAKENFVGLLMDERRIVHAILKWKNPIETAQFVDLMMLTPTLNEPESLKLFDFVKAFQNRC